MSFYHRRQTVRNSQLSSSSDNGVKRYYNFDLISMASSGSEDEDDSKMLKFTQDAGRSYETIAESVFSENNDILDDYYNDTDIESMSTHSRYGKQSLPTYEVDFNSNSVTEVSVPVQDNSDCYSFIIDLIVDYDEVASIISGKSQKMKVSKQEMNPSIDTVLRPPKISTTPTRVKNVFHQPSLTTVATPTTVRSLPLKPVETPIAHDYNRYESPRRYDTPKRFNNSPTTVHSSTFSSSRNLEPPRRLDFSRSLEVSRSLDSLRTPAEAVSLMSSGAYKNDFTLPANRLGPVESEHDLREKKTLKYRVVVTRKNIIKNVKRISRTWSKKPKEDWDIDNMDPDAGHSPNNKLMTVLKSVINRVNSPAPQTMSKPQRATAPIGGLSIVRKNKTKSVALTRLSYKPGPMTVNESKTKSVPLPIITKFDNEKSDIQINRKSILIRDESTNMYNLYALENPYLDKDPTNKSSKSPRLSMLMSGIKLDIKSMDPKLSKKQISLNDKQTLVKNNNDTYTISYDLVKSPVSAKSRPKTTAAHSPLRHERTPKKSRPHTTHLNRSRSHKARQQKSSPKTPGSRPTASRKQHNSARGPSSVPAYKAAQIKYSSPNKRHSYNHSDYKPKQKVRARGNVNIQYSPALNGVAMPNRDRDNRKFFYAR